MGINPKHIVYRMLMLGCLLTAWGCIRDGAEDCPPEVPGALNTIGYMSVRLMPTDAQTRAVGDEFDYGKDEELALAPGEHHFAIFYNDEQAAPVAVAPLTGMTEVGSKDNKTANTTVVFAAIASKSEQRNMLERLKECYVILNANIDSEQLWTLPKDKLFNTIVHSPFYTANGRIYFTMCNSAYVDGGNKVYATKVDTSLIYTSYLEAIQMVGQGKAAVDAYVERLAAKFALRFEQEDQEDKVFSPKDNKVIVFSKLVDGIPYYEQCLNGNESLPYRYRVKITGWNMNALERESYLFRNFTPNANYFSGWYNADNRRAYWSEDLNYRKAVYPWQYRPAVDSKSTPYYKGQDNILENRSFKELNVGFENKYRYTLENTYDYTDKSFDSSLDSRAEVLAGTHMIVCAELETNLKDGQTFGATDLYRDRNGNFYRSEADCFLALVTILNNHLKSHAFLKFKYYDWKNGGGEQTLFAKTNGEYALWYNGSKLTPDAAEKMSIDMDGSLMTDATIKGGDGKRLIWMDGMEIRDKDGYLLDIYSNIDEVDANKNVFLRKATENDFKSLLLEYIGAVDHFNNGAMYYAVPVGYVRNDEASSENNDVYSIYGVVRNSTYDILIHDVTGLGTSVDNWSEPIVPNTVTTNDHLFISFKILDWHKTPETVPGVIQ